MAKAIIVRALAEELRITISALERKIGAAPSALKNAIDRDSNLSLGMVSRIKKAFPQVRERYLLSGELPIIDSSYSEEKPEPETVNYKDKYLQMLEQKIAEQADKLTYMKELAASLEKVNQKLDAAARVNDQKQDLISQAIEKVHSELMKLLIAVQDNGLSFPDQKGKRHSKS